MILQYIYKPILNFIYENITYKMSEKLRNMILAVCAFGIILIQFLSLYEDMGVFTSPIRNLSVLVLSAVIIIASVNSKTEILQWNKILYCPFALIAVLLLITGLANNLGLTYVANGVLILTACVGIYFVWGNRGDYDTLFEIIAKAFITFNMILMVYSVLRYPCFDLYMEAHTGYTIMGINTNGFAKILVPGVASAMYLIIRSNSINKRIVYSIIFGITAYILWITNCRSAQMCDVVFVVFGIVMLLKGTDKTTSKNVVAVIVSVIIGIALMGIMVNHISPITAKYLSPNIVENTEKIIEEKEAKEADKIQRWKESGEKAFAPGSFSYAVAEGRALVGDSEFAKKLNSIATGRVYLWASYLDGFKLFGAKERTEYKSPHNLFIDIGYKSGIIAGGLWLIVCLMAGGISLVGSLSKNKQGYVFTFLMFVQFFLFAMLDTGTLLIDRSYIFVFYIALIPTFIITGKTSKEVKK